jgi:hypothetical protein
MNEFHVYSLCHYHGHHFDHVDHFGCEQNHHAGQGGGNAYCRKRPAPAMYRLAGIEVAALLGLALRLWVPLSRIAASFSAVLEFIGAEMAHVRAQETKGLVGALVPFAVATTALMLRVVTASIETIP